jgi:antitoxin ParD1/3/4
LSKIAILNDAAGGHLINISLTPQLEALIRQKVETGMHNNASEVVREALWLMEERERYSRPRAALAIGDEQSTPGDVTTWTPGTLDQLKREANEEDRQGFPISGEVQP